MKPFIPLIIGLALIAFLLWIIFRGRNWHIYWGWVGGIISLFGLTGLVLWIASTCGGGSGGVARNNQPAYTAPSVTVVKVGKEKNLYRFSDYPTGCVSVLLRSDAEFYPKGGRITIQNPLGTIWPDEPGSQHDRGNQPPGQYTVCKADRTTWGVEVWN